MSIDNLFYYMYVIHSVLPKSYYIQILLLGFLCCTLLWITQKVIHSYKICVSQAQKN